MIFAVGRKLFARVDHVPGLFHIATQFFHLWYCPLIPLASYIVTAEGPQVTRGIPLLYTEDRQSFRGVRIPLCWKSVLLAWARVILLFFWIVGGLVTIVVLTDKHLGLSDRIMVVTIAAGSFVLWLLSLILPSRLRPTYKRACELAQIAVLDDQGWAQLNAAYGQRGGAATATTPSSIVAGQWESSEIQGSPPLKLK